MYNRTTHVTVVALAIILGGGLVALTIVRAQHPEKEAASGDSHGRNHEDHGDADSHEEDGDPEPRAGHASDDHGKTESVIRLSPDERGKYGVRVEAAASGNLATRIRLPGEIVLNADRVAHIVPRATGIVREVLANVGDSVHANDLMAWLESAELGEAKVDYLAKWSELGCRTVDIARAQAVRDNTLELLELLNTSPSLETLRDLNGSEMGENRSTLVSAYAELVYAEAAYRREKPLFEKKVASERDYQAVAAEYKKADALYTATRDSISFKVRRDLLEAKRERNVNEIEITGARSHLFVLGIRPDEIAELESLAQFQTKPPAAPSQCTDPNCKDCKHPAIGGDRPSSLGQARSEERLAWYPLRAPFDGTVIEKHLTLGEKHSGESGAFTVADLTSVWVNIAVYQKDLPLVREGMSVSVSMGAGEPGAEGIVEYVTPVIDRKTRTALARVVLPNPGGVWRPGLFVNAEITVGREGASVVIPEAAIQRLDEEPVVFVETPEGFTPTPVSLGRSSESRVEILSGLAVGQRYVTQGAFELKAKIVTSGIDAHAGHGH